MTPDEIHVAGLALDVRIGVTDRERAAPQRLTVSLGRWVRQAAGPH